MPTPKERPRRLFNGAALIPFAFLLLVGWAMMAPGASTRTTSSVAAVGVLTVFVACFGALSFDLLGRVAAVAFGAGACLFLGAALRFYSPVDASVYLWRKTDTLLLLAGVGVVTGVLAESGLFSRVAYRFVRASAGNPRRVAISLCVATFLLSSVVNNLAAILVLIPLSLIIAEAMDVDAHVLVLGEVIASNLGGASTMIGDFPNVLIATEVGVPFHEFLLHLAPVCVLQLGIVLAYVAYAIPARRMDRRKLKALLERLAREPFDLAPARRGLAILALMLAGFTIGSRVHASPAVVAALGGGLALLVGGVPRRALVRHLHLGDVLFFACLFVMVGAAEASGILDGFGRSLVGMARQAPVAGLVVVAWSGALMTTVLNAGPTTALLVPILLGGPAAAIAPESTWWALSLGVCAGSSATLTGATAGPVAASLLEQRGLKLSFVDFARTGVPLMFAFMIVNVAYLLLLASW